MISFETLDKMRGRSQHAMTQDDLDEAWELIIGIVKSSAAFQRFAHKYHHGDKIKEPWEAIGHRMFAAMQCLLGAQGKMSVVGTSAESNAHMMTLVAGLLTDAVVYLWQPEIEKIADAAPLPKHVISRSILASPVMFWSLSEPATPTTWLAVIHATDDVILAGEGLNEQDEAAIGLTALRYGDTWPNDFHVQGAQREISLVLKRCAFLQSPFIMTERHKMPRHVRRQAERAGEFIHPYQQDESVHVVKLRRLQMRKGQPSGEHHGVEWKHHWWVNAFYRAQWYPSEQAHKVIWIAPFLKGDLSKPLLEKIYAVVR